MSRFPKNLRSIYSADKFRDYCLHPMGIKVIIFNKILRLKHHT